MRKSRNLLATFLPAKNIKAVSPAAMVQRVSTVWVGFPQVGIRWLGSTDAYVGGVQVGPRASSSGVPSSLNKAADIGQEGILEFDDGVTFTYSGHRRHGLDFAVEDSWWDGLSYW
jgi:hypothetical protein